MTNPTSPPRPSQCLSLSRALFGFAGVLLTLSALLYFALIAFGMAKAGSDGALARDVNGVLVMIGAEAGMLILAALCWRGAGWRDPA